MDLASLKWLLRRPWVKGREKETRVVVRTEGGDFVVTGAELGRDLVFYTAESGVVVVKGD